MKKILLLMAIALMIVSVRPMTAKADSNDNIADGVYMGSIDLSGLTAEEAKAKVSEYVETLKTKNVTFGAAGDHYVAVMAGDLGLEWTNESDIDVAASLGKKGNIVKRYKSLQDLKYGNKVYNLELSFDKDIIKNVLEEQCAEYDVSAQNATMTKVNGQFVIEDGQTGEAVNVEESLNNIYDYLTTSWDYTDASIDLVIDVTEPKGSKEQLSKLTDVLGTYTTSYSTSSSARCKNVENGCRLINGTLLYPGEEFSTYNTIKPFTEANGYYPAGSYLNGKVVESLGGGICQVSTTLYNAVLLSELDVTERNNHSMIVTYVKPSMDAAIAESSGKDFKFVNNYENPIYIEGVTAGKEITFTIYGVDTRDAGHKVSYISETLTTTQPDHEEITASSSMAIGEIDVQSAHIGYTAQLWKVVTENGVEVSREVINKSTYKVSPRSATVGIASDNATYVARMQAAIATGSIDTCKAEAAAIKAEQAAATEAAQQQADLEAYYNALAQQQAAAAGQ
jgi:vancomycin resistance protein YoaR